jgi:hypothetical protein
MCKEQSVDSKADWETIYKTKQPHEVSWYQREAQVSLGLIRRVAPEPTAAIIDVGGGHRRSSTASWPPAIAASRCWTCLQRRWIWRARGWVLRRPAPRGWARYIEQVRMSVKAGAYVLVATFAHDGPARCSGLPVARCTAAALHQEFGSSFRLVESTREEHVTPSGTKQAFVYCLWQVSYN